MLCRLYETAHPRKALSQSWSSGKSNSNNTKGLLPYLKPMESKKPTVVMCEKPKEMVKHLQQFLS